MWAYHLTIEENLPSIARMGLKPHTHAHVEDNTPVIFVERDEEGLEPYVGPGTANLRFKTPGFGGTPDGEDVLFGGPGRNDFPDAPFVGGENEDGVIPPQRIQIKKKDRWYWLTDGSRAEESYQRVAVNDNDEVTSPHQLAALFLAFTEGTEDPDDYENDPRVPSIVDALHRVGINRVAGVLGTGSFGIAARTEDGHVVKLTADPAEVQIGALLVGKRLPHVVSVFGAWYVCGVRVNVAVRQNEYGSLEREPLRAGILVEQLVDAGHLDEEGSRLSAAVFNFKEQSGNRFEDYSRLSPKARRQKLFEASQQLEAVLRSQGRPLFTDVADALRELRSEGIFAIDVHGGNVGWDNRAKAYRVFDVGVGSTPPGSPQPPCRGPRGHTRQQQQVAEAVAPPTRVLEIGEAPRALPPVRRTTPGLSEYAADFLMRVEVGGGDLAVIAQYQRDSRTPVIVNALERIGVRTIDKKLGFGSSASRLAQETDTSSSSPAIQPRPTWARS